MANSTGTNTASQVFEPYTVRNICVNLTELSGSPSNSQYYFICHILPANLWYAVEATEFNQQDFLEQVIFFQFIKMTDKLNWSVKSICEFIESVILIT